MNIFFFATLSLINSWANAVALWAKRCKSTMAISINLRYFQVLVAKMTLAANYEHLLNGMNCTNNASLKGRLSSRHWRLRKFTKKCDAGAELLFCTSVRGWLFTLYRNDFHSGTSSFRRHVFLYICLHGTEATLAFPYKSILFSIRIKFSFWYEISFWYHKNWKRTFFALVFGVLVAVTVLVA